MTTDVTAGDQLASCIINRLCAISGSVSQSRFSLKSLPPQVAVLTDRTTCFLVGIKCRIESACRSEMSAVLFLAHESTMSQPTHDARRCWPDGSRQAQCSAQKRTVSALIGGAIYGPGARLPYPTNQAHLKTVSAPHAADPITSCGAQESVSVAAGMRLGSRFATYMGTPSATRCWRMAASGSPACWALGVC